MCQLHSFRQSRATGSIDDCYYVIGMLLTYQFFPQIWLFFPTFFPFLQNFVERHRLMFCKHVIKTDHFLEEGSMLPIHAPLLFPLNKKEANICLSDFINKILVRKIGK